MAYCRTRCPSGSRSGLRGQIDWQARSPEPARWAAAGGANARAGVKVSTAYLEGYGSLEVRAADCIEGRMAGSQEASNEVGRRVGERVGTVR